MDNLPLWLQVLVFWATACTVWTTMQLLCSAVLALEEWVASLRAPSVVGTPPSGPNVVPFRSKSGSSPSQSTKWPA